MTLTDRANRATLTEAAEIVGVKYATLRQAVRVGSIPSLRDSSGRHIICLTDAEAYLASRRLGRPPCYDDDEVRAVMRERGLSWDSARKRVWRLKKGKA